MRSTAVRLAATLVTQVERGSPQAGPWTRAFRRFLIPVGSAAGLAAAFLTDTERPPHGINPAWNLGMSAVSAALVREGLKSKLLGSRVLFATNAVNVAVQLFQIGRWGTSTPLVLEPGAAKTKVVVLGSGWGSMTFVKHLAAQVTGENGPYDLTVVSPRSHFLFTPLLPAAVTGTVQLGSIVESVRSLLGRKGTYYEAEAFAVDPARKVVKARYNRPFRNLPEDQDHAFEIPYDVLIVAVGAVNNTFHTPGVREHAFFLKETGDAALLRNRVNECFELASLPGTTAAQRKNLLTFAVVGGGPTGVETAAELHDCIVEDILKRFPLLKDDTRVVVVDTRDHILSTFDRALSMYADEQFARQGIDVIHNSRVQEVLSDGVIMRHTGVDEPDKLEAGTTIWCTGIKINPVAAQLAEALPAGTQEHVHALKTDHHLVVKGSGGTIFALGDAATIQQDKALDHAAELFRQGDVNGDGVLTCDEIQTLMASAQKEYPQLAEHLRDFNCEEASGVFDQALQQCSSWLPGWMQGQQAADTATAGAERLVAKMPDSAVKVDEAQFKAQLEKIDKSLRALPATAQVASQEGKWLANLFNTTHVGKFAANSPNGLSPAVPPFHYRHLGSFAFIGADNAVLEVPLNQKKPSGFTGFLTGLLWKGLESYEQISLKNKIYVTLDWCKTKVFGRDTGDVH